MGLDLGGGYGAEGAVQGLQQLIAQRQAMRAYADQQQQQQTDNAFKQQQLAQQDALTRASIDERAQAAHGTQAERLQAQGLHLADTIPPGTILGMQDPAVGTLQTTGYGSLVPPQNTLPSTQTQGDIGAGAASQTAQSPSQYGYLKTASSKQQDDAAKLAEKASNDANNVDVKNWLASIAQTKADQGPREPTPHFNVQQTYDGDGKPNGLVRINTLDGSITPVGGNTNLKPPPGAANATKDAGIKKDTLDTLDQLDQAIEAAKGQLGPGAGRVSNIEQMIGSGDPALQALGAKMKGAKMRVDHALTGSVRAGASPAMMAQWDNIFANKVTPEGLHAGVQAMRELIGGGGTGKITVTAPDGSVHPFDTQAQANTFKQLAGIK
jgi:hypothetical protein